MAHGKNRAIVVYKNPNFGVTPGEVLLAQRHFEKEEPTPVQSGSVEVTYNVPVDLLDIATPEIKHSDIRSVQAVYKRRTANEA